MDDLIPELSSGIKPRHQANELRYDKNFVETCKSIGKTPKYQYQLLQIVVQIDPDVLVTAQKLGLTTDYYLQKKKFF